MATSKKQIAANRRNAKKSTGPKTKEGKIKSSQNSIKHGLYSKKHVLDSPLIKEDQNEYRQLMQSVIDNFNPQTIIESILVQKIANAMWHYQRVVIAETESINKKLDELSTQFEKNSTKDFENELNIHLIPHGNFATVLMRCEERYERQIHRNLLLLKRLRQPKDKKARQRKLEK